MAKMIIIEGNSNDKDNTRVLMVKGERGDDGISPTVTTSKTAGVTTITITDAEGTHTAEIDDGGAFAVTEETGSQNCNNYKVTGIYHFAQLPSNAPTGVTGGWLTVITATDTKQIWLGLDESTYTRTYTNNAWTNWVKYATANDIEDIVAYKAGDTISDFTFGGGGWFVAGDAQNSYYTLNFVVPLNKPVADSVNSASISFTAEGAMPIIGGMYVDGTYYAFYGHSDPRVTTVSFVGNSRNMLLVQVYVYGSGQYGIGTDKSHSTVNFKTSFSITFA